MAWFAAAGQRLDPDAQRKGSQFAAGIGDFLVHWFMWLLGPAERCFLAAGATPDVLNFAGLALGLTSGVAIGLGQLELGGSLIALGGICDILDGRLARTLGLVSDYGKFIDSTLDRFVEVFVFLGFAFYLRHTAYGAFVATDSLALRSSRGRILCAYS